MYMYTYISVTIDNSFSLQTAKSSNTNSFQYFTAIHQIIITKENFPVINTMMLNVSST